MFKFNTWPPEPGQIEMSIDGDFLTGGALTTETAGRVFGAILLDNMDPPTQDRIMDATKQLVEPFATEGGKYQFTKGVQIQLEVHAQRGVEHV